jgi:hypothetical protein
LSFLLTLLLLVGREWPKKTRKAGYFPAILAGCLTWPQADRLKLPRSEHVEKHAWRQDIGRKLA